jgi:DNA-binding FrmR family transcriptional regulator
MPIDNNISSNIHNHSGNDDISHVHHTHSNEDAAPHSHTHKNTKAVLNRLSKSTGHLNSVKKMVENGRDCSEILIQLAAVRSEINGIIEVILQDHIDHCLVEAVKTGDTETIDELNNAIRQLLKR